MFVLHYKKLLLAALFGGAIIFIQLLYWKTVTGQWVYYSYDDQKLEFLRPHITSGWDEDQLIEETASSSWIILPRNSSYVFSGKDKQLWRDVLSDMGGEYRILAISMMSMAGTLMEETIQCLMV